jgi:hypothetical protein
MLISPHPRPPGQPTCRRSSEASNPPVYDSQSMRHAVVRAGFPALLFAASLAAPAVRQHGLVLEQGVRATFFDGYKPANYTQKWDIPRLRIPPTAVRP